MSFIDLFAWIVLIVLVVSTVAVFVFLAMLPGGDCQAAQPSLG